jgi:hypothetical protein
MGIIDYTFTPLEGSGGLRGKVSGRGDCPEEGDYLMLPYDGDEHRYQVTFSGVDYDRPYMFTALVVRDPRPAGVELPRGMFTRRVRQDPGGPSRKPGETGSKPGLRNVRRPSRVATTLALRKRWATGARAPLERLSSLGERASEVPPRGFEPRFPP